MPDEPVTTENRPAKEIIAPGYTFGTVTDQIATVVLTRKTPRVLVRRVRGRPYAAAAVPAGRWRCCSPRAWASGASACRYVGIRHHQLRVVDRYRPRRHADFRHSAAAQPAVAQFHQPFRRSHDAVRRGLRRHVPAAAPGPSLAVLLAVSVPQHDGRAAASSAARWCGTCSRFRLTPRYRCCSGTSA